MKEAASPFDHVAPAVMKADDVLASWKRNTAGAALSGSYLMAGSFGTERDARQRADMLSAVGSTKVVRDGDAFIVVMAAEENALDHLARRAWDAGVTDAFIVRDE